MSSSVPSLNAQDDNLRIVTFPIGFTRIHSLNAQDDKPRFIASDTTRSKVGICESHLFLQSLSFD